MTALSTECFLPLRQLHHIRRLLGDDSVVTLVHAFVVSRVDYCLGLVAGASTSCNVSSTQPLESCRNSGKFVRLLIHFGNMFYIGSTSLTGSDSDCASRCSNVSTAWLLDTWPSSADLSLASTDTGIYDLLAVASLTFHKLNCQLGTC